MTASGTPRGGRMTRILGWIAVIAGVAILIYELVWGDGLSLVGAGIAAVGAAVLLVPRETVT